MIIQNSLNSVLDRYLKDDTYSYAIMIDGVWGCGKTYFIKKYISESFIAKNKKCIYISLYGLDSINDLNKQIKLQYVFGEKYKKKYEITKIGTSIALDLLESKGVDKKYVDQALNLIKKNSLEGNNLVLILDDLERSTIPVVEVLGYINGLVEHQKYKVIILGNEEEIDYETSNLELKYLIAKDPNLIIKEEQDALTELVEQLMKEKCRGNNNGYQNDIHEEKIDDKKLKERVKKLFSEKSKYFLIKEKVIGITYSFDVSLNDTIKQIHDSVLSTKSNKDYYKQLVSIFDGSIDDIGKIMTTYNHKNLRTYQFYLSKIIGLFECLKKSELSQKRDIDKLIKDINIIFFKECLFFKTSLKRSDKLNLLEDYLADYIRGIINIDDVNFVQTTWKFYDSVNSKRKLDLAIHCICNWLDWNANEIRENMNYLILHVDEIDSLMYNKILNSFISLEEQDIIEKDLIHRFFKQFRILNNERNKFEMIIKDLQNLFLENEIERSICKNYINILNSIDDLDVNKDNPFVYCYSTEKESVHNLDDLIIHNINYLDDEIINKLLKKIEHSTNGSELRKISGTLYKVYLTQIDKWKNNIALQENLKSLNKLKVGINKLNDSYQFDSVIKIWIRNIEQRINHILESFGNK